MPAIAHLFDTLRQHRALPFLLIALGALTPLAYAPYGFWPVLLLSLGLPVLLWQGHDVKRSTFLAWCHGFGIWLTGTSWLYVSMHDYGYTPVWLAIPLLMLQAALMALFFGLAGFLQAKARLQALPLLVLPALWVLSEWLRTWLFTGFPWLFSGYAFIDTPLAGWAPLLGVFGVSAFAVFSCLALWSVLQQRQQWPWLAAAIALWIGGYALQQQEWTKPTGESLSVAIVQGNIPQESKWQLEWRDKTVDIYRQLSKNAWGHDLVMWPEAALPMFQDEAVSVLEEMHDNALTAHSAFVTGIPYIEVDRVNERLRFYNAILALGEGEGLYFKQRLVPFGEYIPFEDALRGAIPLFDMPMTSFTMGPPDQAPLMVQKLRLAPLICYEIAYPDLVRRAAANSDFLTTISNDGWFGTSSGPHQHFEMVRMRALETGREIIRATNNGISAVIDSKGHVRDRAPQFQRVVLTTTVNGYEGRTPYVRFGNFPILIAFFALLLFSGWRTRKSA